MGNVKSLSEYMEKAQTDLFRECGAFFAFGQQQFDEKKEEGVKYVSLGSGMICPKANAKKLCNGLDAIYEQAVEQRKKDYTKEQIIDHCIWNYEAFYNWDFSRVVETMKGYGYTAADVQAVVEANRQQYIDAL